MEGAFDCAYFGLPTPTVMHAMMSLHGEHSPQQVDRGDSDFMTTIRYSLGASWWTLSDNWEGTVLFWTLYYQVDIPLALQQLGALLKLSLLS